jgi:hypothetical protein
MEIKVILLFGLTELKAVISWEDGVSHQFPDNISNLTCTSQGEEIRQADILTSLFHNSDCIHRTPAVVVYDDEQEEA